MLGPEKKLIDKLSRIDNVQEEMKKLIGVSKIPQLDLFPSLLKQKQISATIYTSAQLSEKAREFSRILGVTVFESFPFKKYPSTKCNVSMRDDQTRIYHLPFDQQYDRTIVHEERSECYVETVAEAEQLGFRRAWRWRGTKESD